ncbi:MAG TPA: Bax inhibitor-1/YccA family protein [Phycisphaerales bacterium]|nr:Bax inhibitor-1/YccA family protein [Phycisphaerales bacterium]
MRSANPALRPFDQPQTWESAFGRSGPLAAARPGPMTVRGTVTATSILLGICAAAAVGSWAMVRSPEYAGLGYPLAIGGVIAGLVLGLIVSFKPRTAPFLGPVYAAAEGLFLGVLSAIVASRLPAQVGETVVFQAIGLTFGVTGAMLAGYATRIIRPGRVFRACVVSATGGICLFYLAAFVGRLLGFDALSAVLRFDNGSPISIGVSLVVVAIASLNLVLDFEFIEEGARSGMPKHMEWYGGFALLVTLVWLYVELLRLLSKLRSGD